MADRALKGADGLQRRLKAIESPKIGEGMMRKLALHTVREAKILVPRKTSNLGRSIHISRVSATEAVVEAGANYAAYVEFGTGPHIIRPKKGRFLRWPTNASDRRLTGSPRKTVKGGFTFARIVHHPGTKAQPYLLPGAKIAVKKAGLLDMIVASWNAAD